MPNLYGPWQVNPKGWPARPEIINSIGRTIAIVEQMSSHPQISHPETTAIGAVMAASLDLLQAIRLLMDCDCPFEASVDSCECGSWVDSDEKIPCCHMQAMRAIEKATVR